MAISSGRQNGASRGPAVLGRSPFKGMLRSDFLVPIGELVIGALIATSVALAADGKHLLALVIVLLSALTAVRASIRLKDRSVLRSASFTLFAAAMISWLALDQSPQGQVLTLLLAIAAGVAFLTLSSESLKERARIRKYAALLVFEGRLGSREFYNQKFDFCRALLALSHRSKRPLSVVALRWANPTALADPLERSPARILGGIDHHLQRFEIATIVENAVRTSDIVLVDVDANLILIACPDTPPSGALGLSVRLSAQVRNDAKSLLSYSIASYPEDGYHFEELVSAAVNRTTKAPVNGSDHGALPPRATIQVKKVTDNTRQPVATSNTRLGL